MRGGVFLRSGSVSEEISVIVLFVSSFLGFLTVRVFGLEDVLFAGIGLLLLSLFLCVALLAIGSLDAERLSRHR